MPITSVLNSVEVPVPPKSLANAAASSKPALAEEIAVLVVDPGSVAPKLINPFSLTKICVYPVPLKLNVNGSVTLNLSSSMVEPVE